MWNIWKGKEKKVRGKCEKNNVNENVLCLKFYFPIFFPKFSSPSFLFYMFWINPNLFKTCEKEKKRNEKRKEKLKTFLFQFFGWRQREEKIKNSNIVHNMDFLPILFSSFSHLSFLFSHPLKFQTQRKL